MRGRREGGVGDLTPFSMRRAIGAAAAELAVVGVRGEDEDVLELLDAHGSGVYQPVPGGAQSSAASPSQNTWS